MGKRNCLGGWALALVSMFGLALGLVACGGDEGEETVAQADSICRDAIESDVPQTSSAQMNPELTNSILEQKIEVVRDRHERLAALEAPEENAEAWQLYVANEQRRVELAEEQHEMIERGDDISGILEELRELGVEQSELAEQVGFDVCGFGRYRNADPEPRISLAERLAEFQAAIETEDCDELIALGPTEIVVPEGQVESFCDSLVADFEGFDAAEAEVDEWGTAAVIQNEREDGTTISQPFLLEGDETFRFAVVFAEEPSVGEEATDVTGFDEVAADMVEAVREDDCEAISELYDSDAWESGEAACENLVARLGSALEADSQAAPERIGANRLFAAYELRTRTGGYSTLLVSQKSEGGGEYRFSVLAFPFR